MSLKGRGREAHATKAFMVRDGSTVVSQVEEMSTNCHKCDCVHEKVSVGEITTCRNCTRFLLYYGL